MIRIMIGILYENSDKKILSIMCLIRERTELHKMQKLVSSSYKYQIAMKFKIWGPYMVIRPLREVSRYFWWFIYGKLEKEKDWIGNWNK